MMLPLQGGKQKTTRTKSGSGGCVSLIKNVQYSKKQHALCFLVVIMPDNSQAGFCVETAINYTRQNVFLL
jgi:hypothetical protein